MQPDGADTAALSAWLDRHIPRVGSGPLSVSHLHGGTTNLVLALDRGGTPAVLRRPPIDAPAGSEKAMQREVRLLTALDRTPVPHPRVFGWCDDPAVLGAPFYVMERLSGWAPAVTDDGCTYPDAFDTPRHRRAMGFAVIDLAATLAAVDHNAIGLGDFGRPGSFLERQVDRWLGQLAGYPQSYPGYRSRDLPGIGATADWLRANTPADRRAGIIHGDFGPPNILFRPNEPVTVEALVDWELATIGDPRLDFALFCINLVDERAPDPAPPAAYFDPVDFPTRQEAIARYGERTGDDMSAIRYFLVLAQFRMACILEHKVARAAATGADQPGKRFDDMVVHLASQAEAMIEKTGGI